MIEIWENLCEMGGSDLWGMPCQNYSLLCIGQPIFEYDTKGEREAHDPRAEGHFGQHTR